MPGMTGFDLQRELPLRDQNIPTVFITAFAAPTGRKITYILQCAGFRARIHYYFVAVRVIGCGEYRPDCFESLLAVASLAACTKDRPHTKGAINLTFAIRPVLFKHC